MKKTNKKMVPSSMVFILLLLTVPFLAQSRFDASGDDILQFPINDYTEQTIAVTIFGGQRNVTYRLYRHIAYVANPVDVDYESLDVAVPVKIDDNDIDATNAPILLIVNNAGYMASSNTATGLGRIPNDVNGRYALAAGYVVVCPGLRGWNLLLNGTYYGKAPAAIVDLKAAVRYIRYNDGVMPGNNELIIASGVSGGGALSTLLGVSGNSNLYDVDLEEIGAANASDNIFASAPYYPNPDLDHADMAYEWEFGTTPYKGDLVNQSISEQLKDAFSVYQASLNLQGKDGYGNITAENYGDYLVETYLIPSANEYLNALTNEDLETYLSSHAWITWSNNSAAFSFAEYVAYIGRTWGLPAFDAFDLSAWGNTLFGNSTTNARHFTNFSLQYTSGDPAAEIDGELQTIVNMMNSMYFIQQNNTDCAPFWFIRTSAKEIVTMFSNLATILENRGKDVNASLYWDAAHSVNQDPEAFVVWVSEISGYPIAIPEFQAIVFLSILLMTTLFAAIISRGKSISRSG